MWANSEVSITTFEKGMASVSLYCTISSFPTQGKDFTNAVLQGGDASLNRKQRYFLSDKWKKWHSHSNHAIFLKFADLYITFEAFKDVFRF